MEFSQFYKAFGLKEYPFNMFTTEDEKKAQKDEKLFVEPINYSLIKDAYKDSRTVMMSGNRGTGKTAIVYDLIRNAPRKSLICYIDDFSNINLSSKLEEFYEVIANNLINILIEESVPLQKSISMLSKEDKILLSFLVNKFLSATTRERINARIEKIQLSKFKRVCKKYVNFIRFLLNYGLTAAAKMFNNAISNHFYMLPEISESQIKNILPEIDFSVENNFINVETSFSFINQICKLIHNVGFDNNFP